MPSKKVPTRSSRPVTPHLDKRPDQVVIVADSTRPGRTTASPFGVLDELSATERGSIDTAKLYMGAGEIRGLVFLRQIADVAIAKKFIDLKKTYKFNDLPVPTPDGQVRRVANVDEFCRLVFGKSYRRMQELVANYELLGPELYEQAELIGLTARDYTHVRALPDDLRERARDALAAGDKNLLLELLDEQAERGAALRGKLAAAEEAIAAKDKVIATKDAKLNEVTERDVKLRRLPREERERQQLEELQRLQEVAFVAFLAYASFASKVANDGASEAATMATNNSLDHYAKACEEAALERGLSFGVGFGVVPAGGQGS